MSEQSQRRKRPHSEDDSSLESALASLPSIQYPSRVCTEVFSKIRSILSHMVNSEPEFITAIDNILTKAYTAEGSYQTKLAGLLKNIAQVEVITGSGEKLSVYQLVSKSCLTLPTMSEDSLKEFLKALPFLDNLYRLEMIGRGAFLHFAKFFANWRGRLAPTALICLFEILRIVDKLLDERLYKMNSDLLQFWKKCSDRIASCYQKSHLADNKCSEMSEFLQSLKQKGGWLRKRQNEPRGPRTNSAGEETTSNRVSPIPVVRSNPIGFVDDPQMTPAFRSLLGKVRRTVNVLLANPRIVEEVALEIKKSLANCSENLYRNTIFAILTLASNAGILEQATLIELLIVLEKDCSKKPIFVMKSGKSLHVRMLVSGWAMHLRRFNSIADLEKFRKSLPLINSLYRRRVVMSWIFKYYADEVANSGSEIGAIALFEILVNIDSLADAKLWKYKEDEAAFYEECCCDLAMASQTGMIKDPKMVSVISAFLAAVRGKGGWHRASIAKYLRKSQNAQQNQQQELPDSEDEEVVAAIAANATNEVTESLPGTADDQEQEQEPQETHVDEQKSWSSEFVADTPVCYTTKITEILTSLSKDPENWPSLASELEICLSSLPNKEAFTTAASLLLKKMSKAKPEIFPVFSQLLDSLHKVSIKTKKGRNFSISKAFARYVETIPDIESEKNIRDFARGFRVTNELCRLKFIKPGIFRHYLQSTETPDKTIKSLLAYEVLRNIDQLIDDKMWTYLDDDDRQFWAKTGRHLSNACKKNLAEHERVEEIVAFLEEVERKGGWFRSEGRSETSSPEKDKSEPKVTHAKFCSFLDSNFLTDGVMNSVRFFKSMLLSMSSPCLFTEAIDSILDKIFELNEDCETLEAAVKLCVELNQVNNEGGKSCVATLQDKCIKLFSQKERADAEDTLRKLQQEIETTNVPQEQTILVEKFERLEQSGKQKYMGSARLVGKLFIEKQLSFNFFLAFVNCLLSTRTDDMLEVLLEVLSIAGKEFEQQVHLMDMTMWWSNFIGDLTQISQSSDSSAKKQALVSEMLSLKSSGWPTPSLEQLAARRLRFMLLELSPNLARVPIRYTSALNRVRSFFSECPPEYCRSLYEVFFSEIQSYIADMVRMQQAQLPVVMYSNWGLPFNTMYEAPPPALAPSQQDPAIPSSSSTVPRIVSVTSAPFGLLPNMPPLQTTHTDTKL